MSKLDLPAGHHTVTPGFVVTNATKVRDFLVMAFGGKVVETYDGPGGTIGHCEVMLGDSVVMFGDAMPGFDPMPASLSYYVADGKAVDVTYRKALDAGATSVMPPKDQFYGYRSATVRDVGGNKWTICAIVEKLSQEEIQKRMDAMSKGG